MDIDDIYNALPRSADGHSHRRTIYLTKHGGGHIWQYPANGLYPRWWFKLQYRDSVTKPMGPFDTEQEAEDTMMAVYKPMLAILKRDCT